MAELFVGPNREYKTIGAGLDAARPNDVVWVEPGRYQEQVRMRTPRVELVAAGDGVIIDGRYDPVEVATKRVVLHVPGDSRWIPNAPNGSLVVLEAPECTLDGFIIVNAAGRAVTVNPEATASRVTYNRIDFVYDAGIKTFANGAVIEGNVLSRCAMRVIDPKNDNGDSPVGAAAVIATRGLEKNDPPVTGVAIRDNVCAFSHGEGITFGRNSSGGVCEGNTVYNTGHVMLYNSSAAEVVWRNNTAYWIDDVTEFDSAGDAADGMSLGDEKAGRAKSSTSTEGTQIYNNLLVNLRRCLTVRLGGGYETFVPDGMYIGYNTMVGGTQTAQVVKVNTGKDSKGKWVDWRDSLFENNVIARHNAPAGADISATNRLAGLAFRHNVWSEEPDPEFKGDGDVYASPQLANLSPRISGSYAGHDAPSPMPLDGGSFKASDYWLSEGSPAIGAASDGSAAEGVVPPVIDEDYCGQSRGPGGDCGFCEVAEVVEPPVDPPVDPEPVVEHAAIMDALGVTIDDDVVFLAGMAGTPTAVVLLDAEGGTWRGVVFDGRKTVVADGELDNERNE